MYNKRFPSLSDVDIELIKYIIEYPRDIVFSVATIAERFKMEKSSTKFILDTLAENGDILRILEGVYYKIEFSTILQECSVPKMIQVAKAIAENEGWNICPGQDACLNYLGISTQVPNNYIYASSGPTTDIQVGNTILHFEHFKIMKDLDYTITGIMYQALTALNHFSNEKIIGMFRGYKGPLLEYCEKDAAKLPTRYQEILLKVQEEKEKELWAKYS